MPKKEKSEKEFLEEIEKLLMLQLLKAGVKPETISKVIDIPSKTIRNKFPMKEIKK